MVKENIQVLLRGHQCCFGSVLPPSLEFTPGKGLSLRYIPPPPPAVNSSTLVLDLKYAKTHQSCGSYNALTSYQIRANTTRANWSNSTSFSETAARYPEQHERPWSPSILDDVST